jgi:hypothetical protein
MEGLGWVVKDWWGVVTALESTDLVGRGSCAVPRHRLREWPGHRLHNGQDMGYNGVVLSRSEGLRGRGPDLCISAPGRGAARMLGTGS